MSQVSFATRSVLNMWLKVKLNRDLPLPTSRVISNMPLPRERVKIGAVQWDAQPVGQVQQWSQRIQRFFEQAADDHCHLLVFPEYLPLSLLGSIMPPSNAVQTLTDDTIRDLLRSLAPPIYRHWYRWMSAMSRQYRLTTVAGSALMVDHGRLLNVTVTFDQSGTESMRQAKWHPLVDEQRWGVVPGPIAAPQVMLPWGLSSAVCNDATYYETFRMAQAQGARLLAVPIADPEARYTLGKARRGCFSQVQDVPMVGVVAAATGRLFGLRLTGKAGIYVPSAMSADGSGVLAESLHPVGESFVSAVVSLPELDRVQREHRAQFPVPPGEFLDALYQFGEDG